jgi:hypothetical protein
VKEKINGRVDVQWDKLMVWYMEAGKWKIKDRRKTMHTPCNHDPTTSESTSLLFPKNEARTQLKVEVKASKQTPSFPAATKVEK